MKKKKLNNRQFVTIAIIIVLFGISIIGHNYFLAKRSKAYEDMSIILSQEPEIMEEITDDTSRVIDSDNNNNNNNNSNNRRNNTSAGDTSGRVKRVHYTYNYIGRLKIPAIRLNRGFVKYGTAGNNVDQNITIIKGSQYPTKDESNFILAGHNGSGWNAYFTNIDKLQIGAKAYVTYSGKQYCYKLVKRYKDPKSDGAVDVQRYSNKKQLTLITCKRPDYKRYYLVLLFELVNEKDL